MESKAKLFGHPLHTMLIVFPLGLLATSFIFDVLHLVTTTERLALVSYYMIAAGVIGGGIAAVFGLIDWLAIPSGTRAKQVGLMHAVGNVIVMTLFAISWLLRRDAPEAPDSLAIILSFVAVMLAAVTGWMGGELVNRLGVGVDKGAHLNAPNSLSGRPAQENAYTDTQVGAKSYDHTT